MREFQDVFSIAGEIGNCPLVQHVIDSGDAVPIKQRPWRLDSVKQDPFSPPSPSWTITQAAILVDRAVWNCDSQLS